MHNSQIDTALKVPGVEQSNQIVEIIAMIRVATMIPTFWPLVIKTDSRYMIKGLTWHPKEWENKGWWIGVKNAIFFRKAAYLLRRCTAPTLFEWVKGHTGDLGNEESDKLAKEGAEIYPYSRDQPSNMESTMEKINMTTSSTIPL